MIKVVDNVEVALTPEEQLAWEAEQVVLPQIVNVRLYKSTFIRRLTASEAADLLQVLNNEEAYIQLLYQSVEWFDVTDALVSYLHLTLEAAYGKERADALLAPEA